MAQHVDITDPNIHEPKGASAASVDTVYVSDGAGSGAWAKVATDQLDYTDVLATLQADIDDGDLALTGQYTILAVLADVSTASSVLVPVLKNSVFKRARCILGGAISVADANVSFTNSSAVSMGTAAVIAFTASAEGTGATFTATAANTLTAPTWIKITTDGASTTAQPLYILLEFTSRFN